MSYGQIWSVAVGTALALVVILLLFFLKRFLRRRLFEEGTTAARDQALSDLFLFQAQLEGERTSSEASGLADPDSESEPEDGSDPGETGPGPKGDAP